MPTNTASSPAHHPRRVAIAGATGLVGQHLLKQLLADETIGQVYALGRREPTLRHPKLTALVVDFAHLPTLPAVDEVYLALGTTIRQAGSQRAFRAIDLEANLATAQAALAAGARCVADCPPRLAARGSEHTRSTGAAPGVLVTTAAPAGGTLAAVWLAPDCR